MGTCVVHWQGLIHFILCRCRFLICSFYPDPPSDFFLVVFRIYCITITQRKTHLGLCLSEWQAH